MKTVIFIPNKDIQIFNGKTPSGKKLLISTSNTVIELLDTDADHLINETSVFHDYDEKKDDIKDVFEETSLKKPIRKLPPEKSVTTKPKATVKKKTPAKSKSAEK